MTAPVTYTREQREEAAQVLEHIFVGAPDDRANEALLLAVEVLRQAAAEGQGNERLQAQVAELEGWNDAALKREDELRAQCASLAERVKELEARVAKRAAALAVERKRWNALKKELEHRYATEGIPARKAEVDSILAEMYAAELPQPDAKCECDGGCWSAQGCYQQQAATPTTPTLPPVFADRRDARCQCHVYETCQYCRT